MSHVRPSPVLIAALLVVPFAIPVQARGTGHGASRSAGRGGVTVVGDGRFGVPGLGLRPYGGRFTSDVSGFDLPPSIAGYAIDGRGAGFYGVTVPGGIPGGRGGYALRDRAGVGAVAPSGLSGAYGYFPGLGYGYFD